MSERLTEGRPLDLTAKPNWGELLEEALEAPGQLSDTYNRFYPYSFLNQIALRMQGATEPVATYKKWLEMQRQVQRGSKALAILRPIVFNKEDEFGFQERKVRGFKWVKCLFQYSQTEGEDLPPYEPVAWSRERALASLAIKEVAFTELNGNIQGYANEDDELAINPAARWPLKTTMHELGHLVLKHPKWSEDEYQQHRGIAEFQAEATAYLAMNEIGARDQMNPAESRAYIQNWLKTTNKPDEGQMRAVFTATDKILKAGRDE
jgi:hypothetical protein